MPERIHAEVLSSFLEYRADYREPILDLLKFHGQIAPSVFHALREWNVTLESVSLKQDPANLNEVSAAFALLGGRVSLRVGLGTTGLHASNPNWSEATLLCRIAQAGVESVIKAGAVIIQQQHATVGMHIRPLSGALRDVVSKAVGLHAPELQGGDVRAYGVSVYRTDSAWVVDASALNPEALFIRIDRLDRSGASIEDIAAHLRKDESAVLDLLQLRAD